MGKEARIFLNLPVGIPERADEIARQTGQTPTQVIKDLLKIGAESQFGQPPRYSPVSWRTGVSSERLNVRLSKQTLAGLEEKAQQEGTTVPQLLRRFLRRGEQILFCSTPSELGVGFDYRNAQGTNFLIIV